MNQFTQRGLTSFDWVVIAGYGIGMLLLGLYCARRQSTTKDYFVAGGNMRSFAVGISLFATLLSTISYLSNPGEMIRHGPVILTGMATPFIAFFFAGFWLIPAIMRHRVTSAYELLEERVGLPGRLLAAVIFISLRLVWMGLMLNMCSEALVHMLGLPDIAQPWIVVLVGVTAVGYTALGGLRAVVITDVVQFLLLFGGAILTIALVTISMGGFAWFPTQWAPHWDTQPVFSLDPHVRVTVFGSLVSGSLWWICTAGSDQMAIQRYMATRDVRAARRAFLINSCCEMSVAIVLGLVGFAVLGYYLANPELIQLPGGIEANADKLFPQFIANQLPMGISGLVIVALFAAAMSSVDSGINSVTAVVLTDFVKRFRKVPVDERAELYLARLLTILIGIIIVLLNTVVDQMPGNYLEVSQKTVNLFVAPLFGLFFFALFVKAATPLGAVLGTVYGAAAAVLVAFWDMITMLEPISFQWIGPIALTVNIVAGLLLSRLPTRGRPWPLVAFWCVAAVVPIVLVFAYAFSLA